MKKVNMYEEKTNFSKLVKEALLGEEVIIAKSGRPILKLVPIDHPHGTRTPGSAADTVTISEDFNAPLPDDILDSFHS